MLDRTTWDLLLDASGNIAVASDAYAIAQDAASAVMTQLGEVYYDTTQGLPYKSLILGKAQSLSVFKAQAEAAALTVPGVTTVQAIVKLGSNRGITGALLVSTDSGETVSVGI